jgi:hypothetical protein
VPPIEDSILVGAEPAGRHLQRQAERTQDRSDRPDRHRAQLATLQVRHDRRTDTGSRGEVDLSPSTAMAQHSDQTAESSIVH